MSTRSALLAALALAVVSTTQLHAQEAAGLSEEDLAAIRAVMEENRQAGLVGDWETHFSQFTEDAVLMLANFPTVRGLEALKTLDWTRAIENEYSIDEIDGQGDFAFVRGTYSILHDREGEVRQEGKFLHILRRHPEGSWRFAVWAVYSYGPLPGQDTGT